MDADTKTRMRASAMPLNERLAAWMQWHAVQNTAAAAAQVRDYIDAGRYPAEPYAGARQVEARYAQGGLAAMRKLIAGLREAPEEAQQALDPSM